MKAIVIGSNGFIGQHLLNHLKDKDYDVWGADVIADYVNPGHYFLIDASNSDFNPVFQNREYDVCINCSGAANVPESLINPLRDYYLNTVNVFKILEAIKKFQPECRFINLSSAAVYGDPRQLPIVESATPNPLSPYGFHKKQAEQICKEFYEFWKIKTCSLRIFSAYGEGLRKQLFWDLYKKTETGKPLTLFGTGNESRDFIHISDLVRVIELVFENSGFEADIINVANGEEIMIKDAVSNFFSNFKEPINYSFSGSSREGDPVNWRADISRLIAFGYKPSVDMYTGLKNYYNWIVGSDYK